MKKYRLKKGTPDAIAGTILEWDDDNEAYAFTTIFKEVGFYKRKYVETCPLFFEEIKEEGIEVADVRFHKTESGNQIENVLVVVFTAYIPEEKFPSIKSAIENILNDTTIQSSNISMGNAKTITDTPSEIPRKSSELFSGNRMGNHTGYDAIYTEKDMEDCWLARDKFSGDQTYFRIAFKNYLQSLNK